ncbi:TonB-dependent receptor [Marilutibacter alkalisoli]|uniref:TonB-dependent receptor n=1 Tax=Marilutibacter alkalisoli TaxID=2591633 RepID=A0A514BNE2_9GAMM|nr:TonB-dependent receptor [Lysobacter alkalisoli]QDH68901.1 TonB-dependent receptor [Lysobacter alkalisoli]
MQLQRSAKKTPVTVLAGAIAVALQMMPQAALAQDPADTDATSASPRTQAATDLDTVTVTGFRGSLAEALNMKRDAVGAVDAIVAEDIADFPDQNIAESLQRIPGITITRDSGEGRSISVRGLSGDFTRVRINGMEAIAATGGEGGPNRGRDFDYNVFASELFNSVVVHKTASASLDEGSLGAVVDLNTGAPFSHKVGHTFLVSGQAQYNDVTEDTTPRLAALYAFRSPSDIWAVAFSAAYSDGSTKELGQNTVRWQQAAFNSVRGVDCATSPGDAGCTEVANGFHARIPRYGEIEVERERLGLTGALELRPAEGTRLNLDLLYSKLDASRSEKWLEVLFRGNEGGMDVTDYVLNPATNTLDMMAVDNAWVRSENFKKAWTTEFKQWTLSAEQVFTDTITGHALIGSSSSELNFPYEITFMYDDRNYNGFVYDYSNDKFPLIAYNGADVTDPATFQMSEFRDRPSNTRHEFDTVIADVEWAFHPDYALKAGVNYRKFSFTTWGGIRDSGVCAAGLHDCSAEGVYGIPATGDLSDIYHFNGKAGAGSTTRWVIPNLRAWSDFIGLPGLPARLDTGNVRSVSEKDSGVFVQLDGYTDIAGHDLRWNAGVRYVETEQSSSALVSVGGEFNPVTINRPKYKDTLPAINAAFSITPDLIWRAAAAKVMTRPGLGSLSPGGSVDSFNYRVTYQNPFLDPTRAKTFDTSLEWYFAPESIISLAIFYKDIDSRPLPTEREGTYASTGLPLDLLVPTSPAAENPEGRPWTIRSIENGPGGKLKGYEIGFQMPFSVMTESVPVIRNMGMIGNYTNVDSEVDYPIGTERLFGLSRHSYNFTLYYDTERFRARASAAYRDGYLSGTSGTGNRFEGYGSTFNVDASATYKVDDNWEVTFEALNLTDDYQDRWTDIDTLRRYEYDHTGRTYKLGFRYKF